MRVTKRVDEADGPSVDGQPQTRLAHKHGLYFLTKHVCTIHL